MIFLPKVCYEFKAFRPTFCGGGSEKISTIFATEHPYEALAMAFERVGITKTLVEKSLDASIATRYQEKISKNFRGRFGQLYDFQETWRGVQLIPIRHVEVSIQFHPNMPAREVYHQALAEYSKLNIQEVRMRNHRFAIWLQKRFQQT